jgi:hypothetical protein
VNILPPIRSEFFDPAARIPVSLGKFHEIGQLTASHEICLCSKDLASIIHACDHRAMNGIEKNRSGTYSHAASDVASLLATS